VYSLAATWRAHARVLSRAVQERQIGRTARTRPRPCAPAPAEEAAMSRERGGDGRSPDIAAAFLGVRLRRDGFRVVGSSA
jgi:hypothetical protein